MAKTEKQIVSELKNKKAQEEFDKKKQEFLTEYEAAVLPIFEKYKLALVPVIRYTEQGLHPVYAVDVYHAKQSQPETNGQPDTDNQASAE